MTIVEPGKGRAVIEQNGSGLRITIPAKAQLFTTLFLPFWLIGWAIGEVMVSRQLLLGQTGEGKEGALFMMAWLGAWTVGGAWAATVLLWNIAGKEIIDLSSTTLKRRKQIPIFGRNREYAVASITNLRPTPGLSPSWYYRQNMSFLSFSDGTISFDYGRDTCQLGTGLDEADANYVIGEMCKKVKALCSKSDNEVH